MAWYGCSSGSCQAWCAISGYVLASNLVGLNIRRLRVLRWFDHLVGVRYLRHVPNLADITCPENHEYTYQCFTNITYYVFGSWIARRMWLKISVLIVDLFLHLFSLRKAHGYFCFRASGQTENHQYSLKTSSINIKLHRWVFHVRMQGIVPSFCCNSLKIKITFWATRPDWDWTGNCCSKAILHQIP